MNKFTHGPWIIGTPPPNGELTIGNQAGMMVAVATTGFCCPTDANARLIAAAPDLLEALHEARRAIGDHYAPNDCYATGPVTGDSFRDLVQCPACSAIAMYDAAIAKARGQS